MNFGGIDPGKDGGLVIIDHEGKVLVVRKPPIIYARTVKVEDKKTGKMRSKKKGKDEYDLPGMRDLLDEYEGENGTPVFFTIEKQHALPSSMGGSAANFQRGLSFGLWQAFLCGMGIPYLVVAPQTWQKVMLADTNVDDTKQASKIVARRLWPREKWTRSEQATKIDDGLTDAVLLAEYGRRTQGRLPTGEPPESA